MFDFSITKVCKECENVFSANGGRSCYCSSSCRGVAMRRMKSAENKKRHQNLKNAVKSFLVTKDCKFCKKPFTQISVTQVFCCIACRGDFAVQNMRDIRARKKIEKKGA